MEHKVTTKDVGKTVDPDVEKAAQKIIKYIIDNYGDVLKRLAKE